MFDSMDVLEKILDNDKDKYCIIKCVADKKYLRTLKKVCEVSSLGNYVARCRSYINEIN